jgi:hypothetical protein
VLLAASTRLSIGTADTMAQKCVEAVSSAAFQGENAHEGVRKTPQSLDQDHKKMPQRLIGQ